MTVVFVLTLVLRKYEVHPFFFFSNTQMQLPATGTSLPLSRVGANQNKFNAWCRRRTTENWKFFLFGKVIQPWFDSYQRTVTLSGSREFVRTLSVWLQEHCSLRVLRPSELLVW